MMTVVVKLKRRLPQLYAAIGCINVILKQYCDRSVNIIQRDLYIILFVSE